MTYAAEPYHERITDSLEAATRELVRIADALEGLTQAAYSIETPPAPDMQSVAQAITDLESGLSRAILTNG